MEYTGHQKEGLTAIKSTRILKFFLKGRNKIEKTMS